MDSESFDDEDDTSAQSESAQSEFQKNKYLSATPTSRAADASEKHMVRKLFDQISPPSQAPAGQASQNLEKNVGSFEMFLEKSLGSTNYRPTPKKIPQQQQFPSASTSQQQQRVMPLQIRLADLTNEDSGEYGEDDGEELDEEEIEDAGNEAEILDDEPEHMGPAFDTMEVVEVDQGDDEILEEVEEEEALDPAELQVDNRYGSNYYASTSTYQFFDPRMRAAASSIQTRSNLPYDRRGLPSSTSLVSSSSHVGQQGIKLHIRRTAPMVAESQARMPSSNEESDDGDDDESNSESQGSVGSNVVHLPHEIEISPTISILPAPSKASYSKAQTNAKQGSQQYTSNIIGGDLQKGDPSKPRSIPLQMLDKISKLQNVELIQIGDTSEPDEVEPEIIHVKTTQRYQPLISPMTKAVLIPSSKTIATAEHPPVVEKRKRGRPRGSKSEGGPARRTERKRKPTRQFATGSPPFKVPKRESLQLATSTFPSEGGEGQDEEQRMFSFAGTELGNRLMIETNSDVKSVRAPRGRGRGRPSTGKPRGRPRGSTLKNRMTREAASASVDSIVEAVLSQAAMQDSNPEQEVQPTGEPLVPATRGRARKPRVRGGITRGARAPRGSRGGGVSKAARTPKPKLPKAKIETPIDKIPMQVFEEETRMSADIKPTSTSNSNVGPPDADDTAQVSNLSSTSTSVTGEAGLIKMKKFTKETIEERKPVTADTLFEYGWPNEPNADQYMLQEQVSEYLGVKSFKRKYPDVTRRVVEVEERDFLHGKKIVSETQCDLGLTALLSNDVLDIMFNDFPDKYEAFRKVIQERRELELLQQKLTPCPGVVRDRSAEFMRRIVRSAARWNANLNRERNEERSYSFDLQTYTFHTQKHRMKYVPPEATKVGYYPVAILGGQFCDNYKRYTPAELKYLPLNTVCYGPVLPHEKKSYAVDSDCSASDSDDSTSDSDSSSSSDGDSSDSQSEIKMEDNSNSIGSSSMVPTPIETDEKPDLSVSPNLMCKSCDGDCSKNKDGFPEPLIHCTKCDVANHPSCLELSLDMLPFIKKYDWQCTDCKNCIECNDPADEDKMLFCDLCDRGYHIYCVGLRKVPTGRWHCRVCSICHSCSATQPSPDDRLADWHHVFKKTERAPKYYTHSLCVACHKLTKKGAYCPTCMKCHTKPDDKTLLECRSCETKVHREPLPYDYVPRSVKRPNLNAKTWIIRKLDPYILVQSAVWDLRCRRQNPLRGPRVTFTQCFHRQVSKVYSKLSHLVSPLGLQLSMSLDMLPKLKDSQCNQSSIPILLPQPTTSSSIIGQLPQMLTIESAAETLLH